MLNIVRIVIAILGLAMAALIVLAIPESESVMGELKELLVPTWGAAVAFDLNLGFFLAAVVIVTFERNKLVGLAWAIPIFVMGNVLTCVWAILRLPELARRLSAA